MDRCQLDKYISGTYGITAEKLFEKYLGFQVYRRTDTKKWFAVIMGIPKDKLGIANQSANAMIDIVNFKCDPILVGSLRLEQGFFPAYNMNKENWITAALDGSAPDDTIKMLLEMSYHLTKNKTKKKNK